MDDRFVPMVIISTIDHSLTITQVRLNLGTAHAKAPVER